MKKLVSLMLVLQLIMPLVAFAEWEIVDKDGERFALIPGAIAVKMVRDLGELDSLRLENIELKKIIGLQEEQMGSIKIMLSNQDIRNELFRQREMIYVEQTTYLTEAYEREIEENGRLKLERPSPLWWSIFGGIVTFSLVGLTAYALSNVK